MNVLVTGGAGFIGSYLCDLLTSNGHRVKIIDINKEKSLISKHVYYCNDILDLDALNESMKDIDLVCHLAAKHRFFGVTEKEFFEVNETGTQNVLKAMDAQGVNSIIFYSTVAVYGQIDTPTNEQTVAAPNNAYGKSKLLAEQHIENWAQINPGRSAICIRPTVIFGVYNLGNMYRLIRQIYYHLYLRVGSGENIKSIAYVENIVDATLFLINKELQGFHIFNYSDTPHLKFKEILSLSYKELGRVTPGISFPLKPILAVAQVLDKFNKVLGVNFSLETAILKTNKMTHHRAEKIKEYGYEPPFTIEEGLEKMVKWFLNSRR